MIKVTYIISDINKALAFEWVANNLNKEKFSLSFILLNPGPSELERYLRDHGFQVFNIRCRGKKDWLTVIYQTIQALRAIRPAIIHCHLIQANTIGLIAGSVTGIRRRIYTRHHSSLHHVYFPKGVWWDKLSNRLATDIVAISGIVEKILTQWEHVPESKVKLIPHGFLLDEFAAVSQERIKSFKERYGLSAKFPVIGVISRFTEWKGVQYIIPAFKRLLESYPQSVLLLLNAQGDYEQAVKEQLRSFPESSYRLISFEKDIAAAYKAMHVFVHVPVDEHSEAFGQIYIEALAAGVPSVFTRSGIANDPRFSAEVASMVSYRNPDQILEAIKELLESKEYTEQKVVKGKELASSFDLPVFIKQLEWLYSSN